MWNDLSIGYLGEYIADQIGEAPWLHDCCIAEGGPEYYQKIDAVMYSDLVASYSFDTWGSTTTLSGGITNLTDEEPPYINKGFNANTDPSTYRLFGRGYYLRLAWKY